MIHFTAGTRQPCSIDALAIARISVVSRPPRLGVKPTSRITAKASANITTQHGAPEQERNPERGELGHVSAHHRAREHGHSGDNLPLRKDRVEAAGEPGGLKGVDQPRLHRSGEEREPKAEQRRHDRPLPEGRAQLPEEDVEQRGDGERDRAQQVRRPPPDRVRHDAGGHLEEDHPDGEERVGRERLEVGEPGIEQEDRVDPPDERRGQRVPEQEHEIDPLDGGGCGHGPLR